MYVVSAYNPPNRPKWCNGVTANVTANVTAWRLSECLRVTINMLAIFGLVWQRERCLLSYQPVARFALHQSPGNRGTVPIARAYATTHLSSASVSLPCHAMTHVSSAHTNILVFQQARKAISDERGPRFMSNRYAMNLTLIQLGADCVMACPCNVKPSIRLDVPTVQRTSIRSRHAGQMS